MSTSIISEFYSYNANFFLVHHSNRKNKSIIAAKNPKLTITAPNVYQSAKSYGALSAML